MLLGPFLVPLLLLALWIILYPHSQPYRYLWIVFGSLALAIFPQMAPSHAVFFAGAETYFKSGLPDIAEAGIAIIFFVLRAIFLIYVGSGLIQALKDNRTGESDWQETARKPVIAIVIVGVADVLTTVIVG